MEREAVGHNPAPIYTRRSGQNEKKNESIYIDANFEWGVYFCIMYRHHLFVFSGLGEPGA